MANKCFLSLLFLIFFNVSNVNSRSQTRVLVVSLDGFHYDYLNQFNLPNFQAFADGGLHAVNGLKSIMTTKTLPIHWSLATGMYQEATGFVGNWMYDPVFNESFKMNKTTGLLNDKWLNGEPIWITAKKQGRRTGVLDWFGSDVEMTKYNESGGFPDKWQKYNSSRTFFERLTTAFNWFVEDNLNLVMMYHPEPDDTGHNHGAGSAAVQKVLEEMDQTWHKFMHALNGHPTLQNKLTIILMSDHGMVNVTGTNGIGGKNINFHDYFPGNELNDLTNYYDRGVVSNIFPKNESCKEKIISRLENLEGIKVYEKKDIPDEWHIKNSSRIGDIFFVADEGNQISDGYVSKKIADHGYDPNLDSMKPFFAANGYKIDPGSVINDSNIESINVHSLICKLLKIKQPEESIGNWSLILPSSSSSQNLVNYILLITVSLINQCALI